MRRWTTPPSNPQEFTFLLFPRFSNHCLANAVEPLRAANELLMRDVYRWRFVTLDGQMVQSSSGLPVQPNGKLKDHAGSDCLFVVSSYDVRAHANQTTKRALQSAAKRFAMMAGMDTGTWLMAHAGLLDGRTATIHLNELVAFSETFDMVDAVSDRYVIDDTLITCGGAMTSFDLILEMMRRTHGEAIKLEVSAFFLQHQQDPTAHIGAGSQHPASLENCLALMKQNLEAPLSVPALAASQGLSQRALLRMFQTALGASPQKVYQRLRLEVARDYAKRSNYTVLEIAIRCGYRDASAMTRAFVAQYGQTPSDIRRAAQVI